MCGICGQFNFGNSTPVQRRDIEAMTKAIIHRGPDDEGYYITGPLGFGFRRLSIIDLAGGHQPMSDQEESVWVIFNGEIYNFHEVRRELEGYGHVFRTNSDTEVIVHLYEEMGADCVTKLRGMFAIALYDAKRNSILLARDRLGKKPLYYAVRDGRLYFGYRPCACFCEV